MSNIDSEISDSDLWYWGQPLFDEEITTNDLKYMTVRCNADELYAGQFPFRDDHLGINSHGQFEDSPSQFFEERAMRVELRRRRKRFFTLWFYIRIFRDIRIKFRSIKYRWPKSIQPWQIEKWERRITKLKKIKRNKIFFIGGK